MAFIFLPLVLPAFWIIFSNHLRKIQNSLIKFSLILFLSTYISIFIVFCLSIILALFTTGVLQKAVYLYLAVIIIFLFIRRKNFVAIIKRALARLNKASIAKIIYFALIFITFYLFFSHQLALKGTVLYRSFVYWDFHWHVQEINNFSFGANFPPQNESISGVYNIYHFFWSVIPAVFQVLGLDLATAINLYSALFFTALIISAIGIAKEYLNSYLTYLVLPIFIVATGSLKLINFIIDLFENKIRLSDLITTTRPDNIDFNQNGFFGYNGNMFNMFYFIEERQLIFACFALLVFIYLLLHHQKFSKKFLIFLGSAFGLFCQWHLFVAIAMGTIAFSYSIFTLIFSNKGEKIKILFFTAPFLLLTSAVILVLKHYVNTDPHFDHNALANFPKINFEFSTSYPEYTSSFKNLLGYYLYAYGARLMIYLFAFYIAFKKNKKLFYILLSSLSVFVLLNTVQLSPLTIYDNHKWLKPFNVVIDTLTLPLFLLLVSKDKVTNFFVFIIISLSVFWGMLSFISFFSQKTDTLYSDYNDQGYKKISQTPGSSVFLTDDPKYVFLAGRKAYIASYLGENLGIKTDSREKTKNDILQLPDQGSICKYIIGQKIQKEFDYVYLPEKNIFFRVNECR